MVQQITTNEQLYTAVKDYFEQNADPNLERTDSAVYAAYGSIESWQITTGVTNMEYLFFPNNPNYTGSTAQDRIKLFNKNIGAWNTSGVVQMQGMFAGALAFNQDISSWNTGNVTETESMFSGAKAFNNGGAALATGVNKWNMSKVGVGLGLDNYGMISMFSGATAFKGLGLDTWIFDATSRPSIRRIFLESGVQATENNYAIWYAWRDQGYSVAELWETSTDYVITGAMLKDPDLLTKITSNAQLTTVIKDYFEQNADPNLESNATAVYNDYGPISYWQLTRGVTNMAYLFSTINPYYTDTPTKNGIPLFNKNIGAWNTSGVTTMIGMFSNAKVFNNGQITAETLTGTGTKLLNWDTSKVTNMSMMFYNANAFNQNISSWNTSNVEVINWMFNNAADFNNGGAALETAINKWNMSKVSDVNGMFGMFYGATAFKGLGLDTWIFAATKPPIENMFTSSGVPSSVNNGKIWNAWSKYYSTRDLTNAKLNVPAPNPISVISGWNLIGASQYLFLNNRDNISYIYGLSGGSFKLINENELPPGGYWLYWNTTGRTILPKTFQRAPTSINVRSGWNLIGSSVAMNIIGDTSNISYIYGLQEGSFKVISKSETLTPGGYWLYWNKAELDGTIGIAEE